jgi:hypothetical protein
VNVVLHARDMAGHTVRARRAALTHPDYPLVPTP